MKKIIVFFVVLSLAMTGCVKQQKGAKNEEAIPVKVVRIKNQDLKKLLEYVGNIKGQDEAIVYPKISGKIIEKVKEDGSVVAKGDAIAYIDRDEVGLKFEKAPVESPLAGIVGRVYIDIGSNVTPQTPIALVADMSRAEIDLDIPEKYLPGISVGQDAEIVVDAYPDEIFAGKVRMVSPVVDLYTRAAPIEISIDNQDKRLHSGMFAKVKLITEVNEDVPVILKESVVGKKPDTYVYVIEGNRAVFKKVTLGSRQGPYYEVVDGLKEGDLVVIMGQQKLRDGSLVAAEE